MGDRLRIYIGGLGSNVQEEDLKKTFSSPQLGTVQSVEINRSKGRSFGYLEYVPVSDKGLSKLFSTYNGCMWKGGRLKLEKAREDYLSRLRREWTEDADLEIKSSTQDVDASESVPVMQKPPKDQDISKLQLKLFFPKLRKIRSIPFKGTGKHKYSFQRVEVPPLPINFCDCEVHSGSVPPESVKRSVTVHREMDPYGVNEDEINMMKSILNKFLEKDDKPKTDCNDTELNEELNKDITTNADILQVDDHDEEEQETDGLQVDEEEEQASDEDNLVINIVGQPSKKVDLFENWGHKTTALSQDSLAREPEPHVTNRGKLILDKKRKQPVHDNHSNDITPSEKKSRKVDPREDIDNPVAVNTKSSTKLLSSDARKNSRKSAWRDLVIEKKDTTFHISDILAGPEPSIEPEPESNESDDLEENSSQDEQSKLSDVQSIEQSNESDDLEEHSSQDKEQSKLSDVQLTEQRAPDNKVARGAAWLQKSSWLQLIADANKSTFNISQILPGATSEEHVQQHGPEDKDTEYPVEDIGELGDKDISDLEGEKPDSDIKHSVEEKENEVFSGPVNGTTNLWEMNRVVPEIVIGETCPFMKSSASMKEWMKAKAALNGAQRKTRKGKEPVQ